MTNWGLSRPAVFLLVLWCLWAQGLVVADEQAATTGPSTLPAEPDELAATPETRILDELDIPWAWPMVDTSAAARGAPMSALIPSQWTILVEEAAGARVEVDDSVLQKFLDLKKLTADRCEAAAKKVGVSVDEVRDTVRNYLAVRRYGDKHAVPQPVTDGDVDKMYELIGPQHRVRAILLPMEKVADMDAPVSEQELKTRFEQGLTEGRKYWIPYLIELEYITVSLAEVAALISAPDDKELEEYWKANKGAIVVYRAGNAPKEYDTFEAAREPALARYRLDKAGGRISAAIEKMKQAMEEPWEGAPIDEEGYRIPPKSVCGKDYMAELAARFTKETELPFSAGRLGPISQADLEKIPGLKDAVIKNPMTTSSTKRSMPYIMVTTAAFHVRGVFSLGTDSMKPLHRGFYELACGPAFTLAKGFRQQWYLYRVINSWKPRPPMSLDEVKDKLARDVRIHRASAICRGYADALIDSALKQGLQAAVDSADQIKQVYGDIKVLEPGPFAARTPVPAQARPSTARMVMVPAIDHVGSDEVFADACVRLSKSEPKNGRRISIEELPEQEAVAVIEYIETVPYDGDVPALKKRIRALMTEHHERIAKLIWYAPFSIEKRQANRR